MEQAWNFDSEPDTYKVFALGYQFMLRKQSTWFGMMLTILTSMLFIHRHLKMTTLMLACYKALDFFLKSLQKRI